MEIRHKAQLTILKQLLFKPRSRFSDLNVTPLSNDQFTFHLKHLMSKGLVNKIGDEYQLTTSGLELAGRLDTQRKEIVKQPKVSVMVYVSQDRKVLLNERLTDPSKGKISCPVTKVQLGESLLETARRCLS